MLRPVIAPKALGLLVVSALTYACAQEEDPRFSTGAPDGDEAPVATIDYHKLPQEEKAKLGPLKQGDVVLEDLSPDDLAAHRLPVPPPPARLIARVAAFDQAWSERKAQLHADADVESERQVFKQEYYAEDETDPPVESIIY